MTATYRPRVLLSTGIETRTTGLLREDALTGRNYSQAVAAAGGLPSMVAVLQPELADGYVDGADALVITGGVDVDPNHYGAQPDVHLGAVDERRDEFELALYRAFRRAGKPVLGVCRGHQLINVAQGGTLHQHLPAVPGSGQHEQKDIRGAPLHVVTLAPDSRLAQAFGREGVKVNSYHHQAIDRLGADLVATAHSADGLIEAVEGVSGGFVLGVQWHPEMAFTADSQQRAPFDLLVEAAKQHALAGRLLHSPA